MAALGPGARGPRRFGSYDELLASDDVDAVYVALPVAPPTEWTLRALEAGKHVLCAKPMTLHRAAAARCADVAERAGLVCAERFVWRAHPQAALVARLLADGATGNLALVRSALSVSVPPPDGEPPPVGHVSECSGFHAVVQSALDLVAPGGSIRLVGMSPRPPSVDSPRRS